MIKGIWIMVSGLRLLLFEGELRAVLWRMLGILFLLFVVLAVGGVLFMEFMVAWLSPSGDAFYTPLFSLLAWVASLLLTLMTTVIVYFLIAPIAVAPWLDDLAQRTEQHLGGREELSVRDSTAWYATLSRDIVNALRPLLGLIPYGIAALICLLIPLIGGVAAMLIWGYGTIRFLNFGLMDTPASRRGWNFATRKQEFARAPLFYLGLGGAAMAMMFIPLLNLLTLPAAVVGLSLSLSSQESC